MLSVTWGLPIAKENIGLMFSSIGRGMEARRDFQLAKAKINRAAMFAKLNGTLFPKGPNQQQVDQLDQAIDAGEITSEV